MERISHLSLTFGVGGGGACFRRCGRWPFFLLSYISAREVTALKHELRDHAVELGAGVAETLLAGAEGAEVLGGFGDNVVVEVEVDSAGLAWVEEVDC